MKDKLVEAQEEACRHSWCLPCCAPIGLMKECLLCGKTQIVCVEGHEEEMYKRLSNDGITT